MAPNTELPVRSQLTGIFLVAIAVGAGVVMLGLWALPLTVAVIGIFLFLRDYNLAFLCCLLFLPVIGEPTSLDPVRENIWAVAAGVALVSWLVNAIRGEIPVTIPRMFVLVLLAWGASLIDSHSLEKLPEFFRQNLVRGIWEGFLTAGTFLLALSYVRNVRHLETAMMAIVVSGLVYGFTIPFLSSGFEIDFGEVVRRSGLFVDVGPASTYMMVCTIFAVYLAPNSPGRRTFFLYMCAGYFLYTQLLTNSKTAMIAIVLIVCLAPMCDGNIRKTALRAALVPVLVAASLPFLPAHIYNSILQALVSLFIDPHQAVAGQAATLSTRIEHARIGFELATEYPLFGMGFGKQPAVTPLPLHVTYVAVLVETGIVGLLLYLGLIIDSLRYGLRALAVLRSQPDDRLYLMTKALILSMIACLVIMSTQPWQGQEYRLVWLFMGMLFAVRAMPAVEDEVPANSRLEPREARG